MNTIQSRTKQMTLHLPAGRVHGQARGFLGTSKEQQHISFPNNKFKIQKPNPARRSVSPSARAAAVVGASLWTRRASRASAPSPHELPPAPPPVFA